MLVFVLPMSTASNSASGHSLVLICPAKAHLVKASFPTCFYWEFMKPLRGEVGARSLNHFCKSLRLAIFFIFKCYPWLNFLLFLLDFIPDQFLIPVCGGLNGSCKLTSLNTCFRVFGTVWKGLVEIYGGLVTLGMGFKA